MARQRRIFAKLWDPHDMTSGDDLGVNKPIGM